MSERVLHEFSQRITRAKTLLDNTKSQNTALKKEALKLEREYEDLQNARKNAELMEENLRNQYLATKNANDQESQKNQKEHEELNQLRELKKKLKRESDICKADYSKNSLILEELVNERTNLEKSAKQLTEKLEQVSLEKRALQEEHESNHVQIQEYSQKINDLKSDIKNMKDLISSSFGNELRQTPFNH